MFANEEQREFLRRGLTRVFYLAYYCEKCGNMRLVTTALPERVYIACPKCSHPRCHSGLIADGFTRRPLPQFENWGGALLPGSDWCDEDDPPVRVPHKRREVDDNHYISASGKIARLGPRVGTREATSTAR